MFVRAITDHDYVAMTRLEKLAPLETFCRAVRDGDVEASSLRSSLRRVVAQRVARGKERGRW